MRSYVISIVGAKGVGKTSFVLALGATEHVKNANLRLYSWQRPGQIEYNPTSVHILRTPKEVLDSDSRVVVLIFDLTRRDSLAAVIFQWAPLVNVMGRRLLLVGTHADCTSQREITSSEVRDISGEFDGYEEVCCRSGDNSMLQVQLTLNQWTPSGLPSMATDIPLARASICGGFPRPVVTMMMPNSTRCSLATPVDQRRSCWRAEVWQYDSNEEVGTIPVATSAGGDVKLRTISKAIYDIRGAVAEKSKALAKYRDRQVSHWLTRSRYFGPTESSRHKRWQEEQKKRQLAQGHLRHHHVSSTRRQSSDRDPLQAQRLRSVSHPNKVNLASEKPAARRGPAGPGCASSFCNAEHEEGLVTPFDRHYFMQLSESTKHRKCKLAASHEQEQKQLYATKRALRKHQRAASNDMFERSTLSAAAYLDCYDEMDMPPQLQPTSPSLGRHNPPSVLASSSSCISCRDDSVKPLAADILDPSGRHSFELLSLGVEQVGCLSQPENRALLTVTTDNAVSKPISPPSAMTWSSAEEQHTARSQPFQPFK